MMVRARWPVCATEPSIATVSFLVVPNHPSASSPCITSSGHPPPLRSVSDASGQLDMTLVAQAPLQRSMLDTNDCFIVDADTEIFAWVGKGSTTQEKQQVMLHAQVCVGEGEGVASVATQGTEQVRGGGGSNFGEKPAFGESGTRRTVPAPA